MLIAFGKDFPEYIWMSSLIIMHSLQLPSLYQYNHENSFVSPVTDKVDHHYCHQYACLQIVIIFATIFMNTLIDFG